MEPCVSMLAPFGTPAKRTFHDVTPPFCTLKVLGLRRGVQQYPQNRNIVGRSELNCNAPPPPPALRTSLRLQTCKATSPTTVLRGTCQQSAWGTTRSQPRSPTQIIKTRSTGKWGHGRAFKNRLGTWEPSLVQGGALVADCNFVSWAALVWLATCSMMKPVAGH